MSSFFLFPFLEKKFRKFLVLGLSSVEGIAVAVSSAVELETFPFCRALRRLSFILVGPLGYENVSSLHSDYTDSLGNESKLKEKEQEI